MIRRSQIERGENPSQRPPVSVPTGIVDMNQQFPVDQEVIPASLDLVISRHVHARPAKTGLKTIRGFVRPGVQILVAVGMWYLREEPTLSGPPVLVADHNETGPRPCDGDVPEIELIDQPVLG